MNSRLIGELELSLSVAACLGALALAGGIDGLVASLVLLPCAAAPWFRDHLPVWRGWGVLALGALAMGVWAWLGHPRQEGVGLALVVLLSHQRLAIDEERRDRLVLLLGVLMLVGTAARTTSVGFFGVWTVWTLTLPGTLWRPEPATEAEGAVIRRARWRMAVGFWLLSGVLWMVLPRPGSAPDDPRRARTGLADEVVLGSFEELTNSDELVATVRFIRGARVPLRLRGAVLDTFDGRRWTSSAPMRPMPMLTPEDPSHVVAVEHRPLDGAVLVPGSVASWRQGAGGFVQDVSGAWRTAAEAVVRYEAEVVLGRPRGLDLLRAHEEERYLQLPRDLSPDVLDLVAGLVEGLESPESRVGAIEQHLTTRFRYTRRDLAGGPDPLGSFLFERRAGHCEYFATAAAVMARAAGVPARLVVGYAGGIREPGRIELLGRHAHAWTEVHVTGRGWLTVDTTVGARMPSGPSADVAPLAAPEATAPAPWLQGWWRRAVLQHDRERQDVVWAFVGRILRHPALLVATLLALAFWLWRIGPLPERLRPRGRPVPRAGIGGCVDTAMAHVAGTGLEVPPALPPLAAAAWVRERVGVAAVPLVRLAELHYRVAYGGAEEEPLLDEARELTNEVRRLRGKRWVG